MLTEEKMMAAHSGERSNRELSERVRQLEDSLWRIAAELEICGIGLGKPGEPEHLPPLQALTPREAEVLRRLVKGGRTVSIARHLHISDSTVRNHLSAIYRKLGVGSQAELLEKIGIG